MPSNTRPNSLPGSLTTGPWIRWGREDYLGAARDWNRAIRLKPDRASFYAQAAEAYRKLGDRPLAMDYYKKALNLDSDNDRYQKRYLELKAEDQNEKSQ